MTAEEVSVVHMVEEEEEVVVVASSSSKVEIVAEKDKENEKKDLSHGANGSIVKEDIDGDDDGDGDNSYVFVNGYDAVNGDPVESDPEKNVNGIGRENLGVERLETKGDEVKSESGLVKDESCTGIVDQDKEEPIELCHVEGPVDETKPEDLVDFDPVSETSTADHSRVSESPEDCSANGIAKHTVSEAAAVDSIDKQSDSILADTSVEDHVVDFRSKENEDSEMAIVDDREANGDGVANDSVEGYVVDLKLKGVEVSEMAVFDDLECNGDGLANDNIGDNVVDSKLKENADFENNGDCNGDGSANVSGKESAVVDSRDERNDRVPVEGTVSEVSKPEQNDFSNRVEADSRDEQNDGVPVEDIASEVSKREQNDFCNRVEADSSDEQNDGVPVHDTVSEVCKPEQNDFCNRVEADSRDEQKDGVPVEDTVSEVSKPEQNDFSNRVEADSGDEQNDGVPVEDTVSEVSKPEKNDFSNRVEADSKDEQNDGVPVENTVSEVSKPEQNDFSNRVEADSKDEQNDGVPVEDTVSDHHLVENSYLDINNVSVEADSRYEQNDGLLVEDTVSDSHLVENSDLDINNLSVESGVSNTTSEATVSEEAEVSKQLAECQSIEPIATSDTDEISVVANVQNGSKLAALLTNDEKEPAAFENLLDVSNRDISCNNGSLHESGVSNCDTNNNEKTQAVVAGIQFGSIGTFQETEGFDEIERKRPFHFLIRVPRFDDEILKEKIRLAKIKVDEKTQSRDTIRDEMQRKKATCKEYNNAFNAAISQERAARDLHRSKRQEIESIQSVRNIEDIDAQIRNMEHMIQHETLPLKDEKQFIREIKQLRQNHEKLSSNMGRQDEVHQDLDQKGQIEERLKSLKNEADQLKVNVQKAEAVTKAAKKKYHDETEKLNILQSQFKAADDIRQAAYVQLQSLKKQSYEKNKYFRRYWDDAKTATDLALKGDREALQNLCVNQVETFMKLWNANDEFRKEYVRCNVRSTLRRLRTLDGRALGLNEEQPVIPRVVNERVAKDHTVADSTSEERKQEKMPLAKAEEANDKPVATVVEQKNPTRKSEKSLKQVPPATGTATASNGDKIDEAGDEKPKIAKEEEEVARKAKELRKEEEAAKREQLRLEEIGKAKEAQERKRRIAEKAQARAALTAQKEAEQKEKDREKRAKKKERRKMAAAAAAAVVDATASVTDEIRSASTSETPTGTPKESQNKEKPVTVSKRSQKPSQFTKQTKAKSIPFPLRNRGKRRMQPWMWVLLTSLIVFALFLIGNSNLSELRRFHF